MNLRFNPDNYYDHQWQFLTSKKPNGEDYKITGLVGGLGCGKTYIPPRPGEYNTTLCDYSKTEKELGYKPKGNLEKYIKQWLEENK